MKKVNYKSVLYLIPTSTNFSDLPKKEGADGEVIQFDAGDGGKEVNLINSNLQADFLLLKLLLNLDDRNKIILLYQILREAGYNLNHDDCSKTLNISREHYMYLVKEVKKKAKKIIRNNTRKSDLK